MDKLHIELNLTSWVQVMSFLQAYEVRWVWLSILSDQHTFQIGDKFKLLAALVNELQGENKAQDHEVG